MGSAALALCSFDEKLQTFGLPGPTEIMAYRVVVASCTAAGLLWQEEPVLYSHVFIDESGQVGPCPPTRCGLFATGWIWEE